MMKLLRYILLSSIFLVLNACDSVTTNKPLGLPILYEMQGLWSVEGEDDNEYLYVKLLADGTLRGTGISWDNKEQQYVLNQTQWIVSVEDGVHYLNIIIGSVAPPNYDVNRVIFSPDGIMTIFFPESDEFVAAIQSGILTGTVKRSEFSSNVHISDSEQLANFIDPAKFTEQFDVNGSASMRRIYKHPMPDDVSIIMDQATHNHSKCLSITMKEDVAAMGIATLTQAAFTTYKKCMQDCGYEFTPDDPGSEMYIVKNGLGLFTFRVTIKE